MGNLSGRIFITGIKHSGKTTFARLLAERYGRLFVDSDDLVLKTITPFTVREYYKANGKAGFMGKEKKAVEDFIRNCSQPFFMSLGGGACDNTGMMETIRGNGKLIYLVRDEKQMLEVILRHGCPAFLDKDDPEESFHTLFLQRDAAYRSYADLVVDLGPYRDRMETLEMLIQRLEKEDL